MVFAVEGVLGWLRIDGNGVGSSLWRRQRGADLALGWMVMVLVEAFCATAGCVRMQWLHLPATVF